MKLPGVSHLRFPFPGLLQTMLHNSNIPLDPHDLCKQRAGTHMPSAESKSCRASSIERAGPFRSIQPGQYRICNLREQIPFPVRAFQELLGIDVGIAILGEVL